MKTLPTVGTWLLSLAAVPAVMFGQEAAQPVRLTLDAAITRALDASHRVREMRAREAGARATWEARQAADRPQLSVQAGYTRTNHVDEFGVGLPGRAFQVIYPDIPDNYRTRLDEQWPI